MNNYIEKSASNELSSLITAMYLRLSSADDREFRQDEIQRDSNSIKNQRDLLTDFIANNADLCNTKIIEMCDDGYSGTNLNRPGVQHLLELAKIGGLNCIIVKDFSRFGRNYVETGNYIEQIFPFLNVRFISVNDGYDSKYEDSAGNLNVAFVNLIHDLYSKDISAKVKTAKRICWERGENIAAYTIFGYTKSKTDRRKIVIDEEAANIVRQIFNMAAESYNTTKIAKILNENSIPTPNIYKKISGCTHSWKQMYKIPIWTERMVYRIITDERYTGTAINGKYSSIDIGSKKVEVPKPDWVIKENAFDAIVSKNIYIQAQKVLRKVKSKPLNKKSIRYSKIHCGGCGRSMVRHLCKTPVFVCKTPSFMTAPDCVKEQISEIDIERILYETIRRQILLFVEKENKRIETVDLLKTKRCEIMGKIKNLQIYLQNLTQDRLLIYENYKDKKISRETYLMENMKFNNKIKEFESEIQTLEFALEQTVSVNSSSIEQKYMQFAESTELTKEMIDCLVDSVIVYGDNRFEVKLKTTDEFLSEI